jgi:eukaryotic-like serine/threonine-protein kinase
MKDSVEQQHRGSVEHFSQREMRLAALVTSLADRLQAGEELMFDAVCQEHPEFQSDLQEIWGTLVVTHAIASSQLQPGDTPRDPGSSSASDSSWSSHVIPRLPFRIGDYELQEVVGGGGMGVVFLAKQISLNRLVAVKMIRDSRVLEHRQRFFAEAEANARLEHPAIVPVYEIGEFEGIPSSACSSSVGRPWPSGSKRPR